MGKPPALGPPDPLVPRAPPRGGRGGGGEMLPGAHPRPGLKGSAAACPRGLPRRPGEAGDCSKPVARILWEKLGRCRRDPASSSV